MTSKETDKKSILLRRKAVSWGQVHTARRLLIRKFTETDLLLLNDDILDKKDNSPAGDASHAGFETVSLLVDGKMLKLLESMLAK